MFPDARRHVWLVGVLRHFCQSYSKRDGTSNLLGIFGGQHLHHHEMEAARPIKTGIPSCAARSVTKCHGQTFAPPHFLGKRHHFY